MKRPGITIALLIYLSVIGIGLGGAGSIDLVLPKTNNPSGQKTESSAEAGTGLTASTAIELADVAIKAGDVAKLLSTPAYKPSPDLKIDTIRSSLPDVSAQIDRESAAANLVLSHEPSLPVLQDQQQKWQRLQFILSGWLETLIKQSESVQDKLDNLDNLEKIWTETLSNAPASATPELILVKIDKTVTAIHDAQNRLQGQLALVIGLQSQTGKEITRCVNTLKGITDMQQATVSNTLIRDSLPVWNSELWTAESYSLTNLSGAVTVYKKELNNSLVIHSKYILLLAVNFIVLLLLSAAARNQTRKWAASGEEFSPFIKIFDNPVAAALTVSLLIVTAPYHSPLPATIRGTLQVFALAPIIILIRPVIPDRIRPILYAIAFLLTLDVIRDIFFAEQLLGQLFLIVESVAGIAMIIGVRRSILTSPDYMTGSTVLHLLQPLAFLVLLLFTIGFAAAVSGHVRLALTIIPGIISFSVMAMAMFAALRVLFGFVAYAFQVRPLNMLHMVQCHRPLLEKRAYRVLFFAAMAGWIVRHLGYMGLLEPVLSAGAKVFASRLEHGTLSISLADLVFFILTVWATYLLSSFIRFVLSEDVYPRIRVAKGKSFAVSSLLHYLILATGFTIAIGVLGVDLTKFSVLTGALGIGIGFGLQGVVNNFVSGLILLFERPIQVGDTIEVGSLIGNVRKIGIRASTVRTRQGSDIIVPNSQLVTEEVTNWTFGDQMKRIDLPVGVSYTSSPNNVIELLSTVARQHPDVLQDPSPQSIFIGFGDSAINFEVRVWTECIDDWVRVRSELATAVFDAVRAAGLTFPFPQREVRLLNSSESGDNVS